MLPPQSAVISSRVACGIARASHRLPPAADGVDREARGVVVDADAHPAGIVGDVVDAVGRRPAELRDHKVVHPHRLGLALGAVLTAAILEIADQFLLLGVDRDRRLARRQRRLHLIVEVTELRVAVGMAGSFAGLAVGLQAVAHLAQQIGHDVMADAMAKPVQPGRQVAQALGRPQQRRHRVAARRRLDQFLQVGEQARVGDDQRPAPTAFAAHPFGRNRRRIAAQLRQPAVDRAARHPGDPRHRGHPATPRRQRFGRRKPPPAALVQNRIKRLVAQSDRRVVNHPAIL